MIARLARELNYRLGAKPRPDDGRCDDLEALIPAFRERVIEVVVDLEGQGFDPMVWETYRSAERIRILAARGTGSMHSFHRLRCAADIISRSKMWRAGKPFWLALERAAEARGLTHGAGATRVDLPHIQAVPHGWYGTLARLEPAQVDRRVTDYLNAFDSRPVVA